MELPITTTTNRKRRRADSGKPSSPLFRPCEITRNIVLPITAVDEDIHQTLEGIVSQMIGNKCITEGFVKAKSVRLMSYSNGTLKGDHVVFNTLFTCEVCFPVANMQLQCNVREIVKAGVYAECADGDVSPFFVFISRDHFYNDAYFLSIKAGQRITVSVLSSRFQLNDAFIVILGAPVFSPTANRGGSVMNVVGEENAENDEEVGKDEEEDEEKAQYT